MSPPCHARMVLFLAPVAHLAPSLVLREGPGRPSNREGLTLVLGAAIWIVLSRGSFPLYQNLLVLFGLGLSEATRRTPLVGPLCRHVPRGAAYSSFKFPASCPGGYAGRAT